MAHSTDYTTGLVFLNNRYHDPALGVFISVDPLVASTGEPYIYASGNPTTLSDPSGLCSVVHGEMYCGGTNYGDYNDTSVTYGGYESDADYNLHAGEVDRMREEMAKTPMDITTELSFVPVIGDGIDAGSCGISLWGHDWGGAAFDCIALGVPFFPSTSDEIAEGGARLIDDVVNGGQALCSFFGDTPVLMADGTTKPIRDVQIGDMVMAFDPETGERGPRQVTHLWVHQDTMLELELGGVSVTTTEDHPFWNVTDRAWQQAQQLDRGDRVLTADGDTLTVDGLDWSTTFTGTAYNLTVDDIHTYHVQAGDDEVGTAAR